MVFFREFGCSMLQSWRLNLKLPRPLSPPNLIQSSLLGMVPSCHVRLPSDLANSGLSKCARVSHVLNFLYLLVLLNSVSYCGNQIAAVHKGDFFNFFTSLVNGKGKGSFSCCYTLSHYLLCHHPLFCLTCQADVQSIQPPSLLIVHPL